MSTSRVYEHNPCIWAQTLYVSTSRVYEHIYIAMNLYN